jgi:3-hydroxyisobutyrate dehydrogenase
MAAASGEVVAFLGLGQMGRPMARLLRNAGYRLQAFDVSPQSRALYEADGGATVGSEAEACRGAALVITMLPNGGIVQDALIKSGAVKGVASGALVIEMSSSAPMQTRRLGEILGDQGVALIDAPVSGGVARATTGKLAIMVGGAVENLERARPLLQCMAQSILRVGPLGAGHAMKALNNYVSAAGLVAACEAVIVGRAFGLDPETIVDTLNASTGRNNSTETKMKPFVLSGSFGSGFAAALMAKDVATALDLAKSVGIDADGIAATAALWREASGAMKPGADHTAIFEFLSEREGKKGE